MKNTWTVVMNGMEDEPVMRDMRELEGKTCIFDTHGADSDWMSHDGERCTVKMRKAEDEYDFNDIGTMWVIELEDGNKLDAFSDELEEI